MGSHPYFYFTEYQPDINSALQALRQQEFEAGRYSPNMLMLLFSFPPNAQSVSLGASHASIDEALEASDACGTGSILDIQKISEASEFLASWALSADETLSLFGMKKPTRQMVEDIILAEGELEHWEDAGYDIEDEFWETIGRGMSRYIIVYEQEQPSEIFFIGYSVD